MSNFLIDPYSDSGIYFPWKSLETAVVVVDVAVGMAEALTTEREMLSSVLMRKSHP